MDFEEKLKKLDDIVKELESGNLNLEKSISRFEEGIKISKDLNETLEKAEKRIIVLTKKDDTIEEEEM